MSMYLNELWLNSDGVNALIVEEDLDFFSDPHIVKWVAADNMNRCDQLAAC